MILLFAILFRCLHLRVLKNFLNTDIIMLLFEWYITSEYVKVKILYKITRKVGTYYKNNKYIKIESNKKYNQNFKKFWN